MEQAEQGCLTCFFVCRGENYAKSALVSMQNANKFAYVNIFL